MSEIEKTLTRSEQKRSDVLLAAIRLFSSEGYQSTSMDMVAKEAQVSKRTVYNHFESKEVLFKAILQDLVAQIRMASEIPYQPNVTLKSQLLMVALKEVELLKDPCFIQLSKVCIAETIHAPELVAEEIEQLNSSNYGFGLWLTAAINDGKLIEEDPLLMMHHFIGAIKEVFFWPQIFKMETIPNDERVREIIDRTINMFLSEYEKDKS